MKEYITQQDVDEARKSTPVNFGPIGNDVYLRSYSRTKQNGEKEDWYETCQRVVNGNANLVDSVFIEKDEPKKLFDMMLKMEILPAGRHIFSSGIGKDYLFNCFQSDFTPDFVEHFYFTFMRLMEGGGVGANYSDLFVNSREKDKTWSIKAKINLHIVCQPDHSDYNTSVDTEHAEKSVYGDAPTLKDFLSLKYSANWDPGISNGDTPEYIRVEDSREGWANALVRLLALSVNSDKERDYVVDISNIRPRGAILKGFGGKASGPDALVLLLDRTNRRFNSKIGKPLESLDYMAIDHYIAMAVVSGGVRRSSRMAMKYWKDPDIFDFITCKQAKPGEVPLHWTTNISVVVDNKFFRALKKNDEHAKKVYDTVVTNILNNGEPGFINASKAGEGEAPNSYFAGTNPCGEIAFFRYPDLYSFDLCHPAGTKILTSQGYKNIETLENTTVISEYEDESCSKVGGHFKAYAKYIGEKETFLIQTREGRSVEATAEHPFLVKKHNKPEWVALSDLVPGMELVANNQGILKGPSAFSEKHYAMGHLIGDGWLRKSVNKRDGYPKYQIGICSSNTDREILEGLMPVWESINQEAILASTHRETTKKPLAGAITKNKNNVCFFVFGKADIYRLLTEKYKLTPVKGPEKNLPSTYWEWTQSEKGSFIRGLFDADGSVQNSHRKSINLATSSKQMCDDIILALSEYGIIGRKYTTILKNRNNRIQYHIHVAGYQNLKAFYDFVYGSNPGFFTRKRDKLKLILDTWSGKKRANTNSVISSITSTGIKKVYNLEVKDSNQFIANGLVVHNCCLGHVNLDRSKTPDESFRLVTRFLVRATFAKVSDERQKKNVERNRRIGVGFTGYHNWLCAQKIKFSDAANKQEVVKFFQEMYSIVDKEAKKYCSDLRIVECIKKTTIAPTGSVSQLAGCTTGCQPVFSKFYIRRVRYSDTDDQLKELAGRGYKIEKDMYAANTSIVEFICADPIYENTLNMLKADYIQEGKTPEEAEALAKEEAIDLIEDQNEIKLEDFLANQRMLQKEYADNAISITINLDPGNTSVDEIKSVLRHYLPDLKGVTLFPEKGMPQSPYERLTYEKFLELSDQGKNFEVGQAEQECLNGACPIR